MTKKEFGLQLLLHFVVLTTCISLVMGIGGIWFEPNAKFGYEAFFFPAGYAGIAVLLEAFTYSAKERSTKAVILRRILVVAIYEVLVIGIQLGGISHKQVMELAVSIPLAAVLGRILLWILDVQKAKQIKKELLEFQAKFKNR